MGIYRLQTSLQDKSGLPRDQYVNSLYVESAAGGPAAYAAWSNAIAVFYHGLTNLLSPCVATVGHQIRVYDIALPLESPPVYTTTFGLNGPTGGSGMPNEVAICLSFKGDLHPGWMPQSTRGRIYLGPLNVSAASGSEAGNSGRPAGTVIQKIVDDAVAMSSAINGVSTSMVIYSKKHSDATRIETFSCDNEWDTQRTRGKRATSKVTADSGGS